MQPEPTLPPISVQLPCLWDVVLLEETLTSTGCAWLAELWYQNYQVGIVSNAGVGGPHDYTWESEMAQDAFEAEAALRYQGSNQPSDWFVVSLLDGPRLPEVK